MALMMHTILMKLLSGFRSPDREVESKSILQIGLVLERSSVRNKDPYDLYSTELPDELLSLELTRDEQVELATAICNIVKSGPPVGGMFWALSKARCDVYCKPLIQLLREGFTTSDASVFQQMAFALEVCYRCMQSDLESSDGEFDLIGFLRQATLNGQPQIVKVAEAILRRLSD